MPSVSSTHEPQMPSETLDGKAFGLDIVCGGYGDAHGINSQTIILAESKINTPIRFSRLETKI